MSVPYPQIAVRNLPSARCLRDVCTDRALHTSKMTITKWEIWHLPDLIFAPGELTIAIAAPLREMHPLFLTDRRIMRHRQNAPLATNLPTEHQEWTWDQLAEVTRKGLKGVRLDFHDGTHLEIKDRSRAGAKRFVQRGQAALEVVARGGSLTEQWQQVSGIKQHPIDLRREALDFIGGRDRYNTEASISMVIDFLEPDEVPLTAASWGKGLALETRTGVDNVFKEGTRVWAMTDRRFIELQGETPYFRIRRQWPANAVRGARLGDHERRTPDVLIIGDEEIPFPDSPRIQAPRFEEIRAVEAINEAVAVVQRYGS